MDIKKDVNFLFEIGALRNILRSWAHFMGKNVANLAEHTFRVCWIALILAKHEGVEDVSKVLKIALVHDISESRAPDLNYITYLYADRDEKRVIDDMFEDISIRDEFVAYWNEYEDQSSIEAKIVKDADKLDVDIELVEEFNKGNITASKLISKRKEKIPEKLNTDSARDFFKIIHESSPDDWHFLGKNYFNV